MEFEYLYLLIMGIISLAASLFCSGTNALIKKKRYVRGFFTMILGLLVLVIGSLNAILLIINKVFFPIIAIMFLIWNVVLIGLYIHFLNFTTFKKYLRNPHNSVGHQRG